MSPASKISVVVPVHGDRENIAEWLRVLATKLADVPHEILVCHDSDADLVLLGIAEMPARPASLRLVGSTRGGGTGNALRAGFDAAQGDVVVTTTCAHLAAPEDILRLAEHLRHEQLSVVVGLPDGSRSRDGAFGELLRARSELRAYSKEFLDSAWSVDSTSAEVALELAAKAQSEGRHVGELRVSSIGMEARDNRFQPWKWSFADLRRWSFAAWQPAVVWAVGIVMSVLAWNYIAKNAPRTPMWDDLELVPYAMPNFHWTIDKAWGLHNEHRIPLPRMIGSSVYGWTGDIRTMMFVDLGLLIALSSAMILVARKIRGRTTLVAALFPLLWLHTGNHENLLMGFQFALVLPTVLVSVMMMIAIARPRSGLTPGEAIVTGLCLLALPLCGGPGITQALPLALGLAVSVSWAVFRRDKELRAGAAWTASFLALLVVVVVLYTIGFEFKDNSTRSSDPILVLGTALRMVSLAFGDAGRVWWPWSGYAVLFVAAITLRLLMRTWRSQKDERWRVATLLCILGTISTLALSIGYGRSAGGPYAGFAARYITLSSPLLATAAFAWIIYGGRVGRALVPGALTLSLVAANVFVNTPNGEWFADLRKRSGQELEADLEGGMQPAEFLDKWTKRIYPDRGRLYYLLTLLATSKLAPFDELTDAVRAPYTQFMFNLPPSRVEPPGPIMTTKVSGDWDVMVVQTGSEVFFDVPPKFSRLTGRFGRLPRDAAKGNRTGVRVTIYAIYGDNDQRELLMNSVVEPTQHAAQDFDVVMRTSGKRQLVLGVTWPEDAVHDPDRAYFGDLRFQ